MIKIDTNIKIPKPSYSGRHLKYPWKIMKIGDSFLFDKIKYMNLHKSNKKYYPKRFISRTMSNGRTRCWRVK